jgi:ankyrin repeat protein
VHSSAQTIALIKAAAEGNEAEILRQLAAGADINGKTMDSLQVTPLMKAAEMGRPQAVKLLIQKGAKVNVVSRFGFTALMFASRSGNRESVAALLAAGADVNIVGHMFATALGNASMNEIRDMIKKAGATR